MADSKRYLDWYAKARTDYSSALILSEHGGDNAVIAFHCQQAAEKALKGFLWIRNISHQKDGAP